MFSVDSVFQLTVTGLLNGALYALLGWAFALLLTVTGRFHLAFAFTYAAAAMVAAQLGVAYGIPWWMAILAGGLVSAILGVLIEALVYRPVARRAGDATLLMVFVASLGVQIAGMNLLSLLWLGRTTLQIQGFEDQAVQAGPAIVSLSTVVAAFIAAVLLLSAWVCLRLTRWGRVAAAVAANETMSAVIGLRPRRVGLWIFGISSAIGGIAAVLSATSTAASPAMGVQPLFYAFIVAFLVRGFSVVATTAAGVTLGLIESWTALFVPAAWSGIVVFALLLVFVAVRPYDVRGAVRRRLPARRPSSLPEEEVLGDGVRR